jgi:hypothetical protein
VQSLLNIYAVLLPTLKVIDCSQGNGLVVLVLGKPAAGLLVSTQPELVNFRCISIDFAGGFPVRLHEWKSAAQLLNTSRELVDWINAVHSWGVFTPSHRPAPLDHFPVSVCV